MLLNIETLKDWLHRPNTRTDDKLMMVVASLGGGPISLQQIREQAQKAGWKITTKENIAMPLSRTKGKAIKSDKGWELTDAGKTHLSEMGLPMQSEKVSKIATDLRGLLSNLSNKETLAFVEEAIECYERKLWRSAIVMSWIGAVHILYDHVVKHKLADFNADGKKFKQAKWKDVTDIDEMADSMKESEFLDRLKNIKVITDPMKVKLRHCLDERNLCGHPNGHIATETAAANHLEILIQRVYLPFGA